jgi:hypothetical protein
MQLMAQPATTPRDTKVLKVIYIFCGEKRRSDVHEWLERFQLPYSFLLVMREVDLKRGQNVQDQGTWEEILDEVKSTLYDVGIITPPCNTHSRARQKWRSSPGPRPIRSKQWPLGFPWLKGKQLLSCQEANEMVEKTWQLRRLFSEVGTMYFLEHPEDLGAVEGDTPASIWQSDEARQAQVETGAACWARFQCEFGAETAKPTRFESDLPAAKLEPNQGWPTFDSAGLYTGPLPACCPHGGHRRQLLGKASGNSFKTEAASAYPPLMCR